MPANKLRRQWLRAVLQPSTFLGVAMIALAWIGILYHLRIEERNIVEAAKQNSANLARAFEEHVIRTITEADKLLLSARAAYAQNPERFDFNFLRGFLDESIKQVSIVGADGILKEALVPPESGQSIDFSDREHFRVHVQSDKDELYISEPITGRIKNWDAVILTRRIFRPDGSFGGIVGVALDPISLSRFYNSIDVGNDGSIALFRTDGVILASSGYKKDVISAAHAGTTLLQRSAESPSGFYLNFGRRDGTLRFISFRRFAALPLLVSVGLAQHEVFANYWRERTFDLLAATGLTAIIALLVVFSVYRQKKLIDSASEIERAEAAAQQSRERYQLIESAGSDGIWDVTLGQEECYFSPRWKAILGYADHELANVRSTFNGLVHPDDRAVLAERSREYLTLAADEKLSWDVRLRHRSGSYRWVHSRGTMIRDAARRPIRMLGTITDITERKQIEYALTRANQELEARVAERTAELAEEMRRREDAQSTLAQAQKMEAVGQLTAGIAHDFNNLLAVITGGLEFIEDAAERGLPPELEFVDTVHRAARRGNELVRRLLAFSRQAPLKAEPTNADQLVLDTLRLLQRTLGAGIDIVTRLEATAATVRVDRNQLANALLNLTLNARDAMPDGGQLTIVTACRASPWADAEGPVRWPTGEAVCITVTDTGVGMSEDVRHRAFEPFFTTKRDGLGTGLGLSMVLGFVEQTGGHIEIESALGRGTTVTIHLPRVEAESQTDDVSGIAGTAAKGAARTVLLVEDDPDVRLVTAARLKKLGYKVYTAANGDEAIDLIESPASIDITLTDIVLPGGIDGVTLVKEAMRARPRMGVLCMSGYDPTQTHRKWLSVQNIKLLQKPFSRGQLAEALDSVLTQ